ncbi:MAG: immunoglobulin-like domain-containing protein, partial [Clostridia bacterium]
MNILLFQASGAGRYYNGSSSISGGSITSSGWKRIELSFDTDKLTYNYSLGGSSLATNINLLATSDSINYSDYDWSITQIVFRRAGSSDTSAGTLMLDNFVVTEDADVSAIVAGLPDAEKVALYESLITQSSITGESAAAIRSNLTLDAGYSTLVDTGVTVTWRSENPAISDSGVVTAGTLAQTGSLTATITAGSESVTKAFELTVPPAGTVEFYNGYLSRDFENTSATPAEDKISADSGLTAEYVAGVSGRSGQVLKTTAAAAANNMLLKTWSETIYQGDVTGHYFISSDLKLDLNGVETPGKYYYQVEGNGQCVSVVFDFSQAVNPVLGLYRGGYSVAAQYTMPQAVIDSNWFHIDIDMNVISRSYDLYINGVKINQVPAAMNNAYRGDNGTLGAAPMRKINLRFDAPGTIYMDNVSVSEYTDADQNLAEAAVNAALITMAGYTKSELPLSSVVAASLTLPAEGPTIGNSYADRTEDNPAMYVFSDGAALSYTANGVPVSGTYTPSAAGITDITVSAVSNGKTATGSFTRKTAPVLISGVTY